MPLHSLPPLNAVNAETPVLPNDRRDASPGSSGGSRGACGRARRSILSTGCADIRLETRPSERRRRLARKSARCSHDTSHAQLSVPPWSPTTPPASSSSRVLFSTEHSQQRDRACANFEKQKQKTSCQNEPARHQHAGQVLPGRGEETCRRGARRRVCPFVPQSDGKRRERMRAFLLLLLPPKTPHARPRVSACRACLHPVTKRSV